MGIFEAIGPIMMIVIVYVVYRLFTGLESDQKERDISAEVSKIQAETERDKIQLQREQAFLEYNERYGDVKPGIRDADADYRILEDQRDNKGDIDNE